MTDDEDPDHEMRSPRSLAVTASASELGIDPEENAPVAEKINSSEANN